jgi:hypothetical protein
VGGVAFDPSGVFLAVGGTGANDDAYLTVRAVKEWSEIAVRGPSAVCCVCKAHRYVACSLFI